MRFLLVFITVLLSYNSSTSQVFSKKDSLRGYLYPERSSYDVFYYDLNLNIVPEDQYIEGYNDIYFHMLDDMEMIQIDLFENLNISKIELFNLCDKEDIKIISNPKEISFDREFNAVYVNFSSKLIKDQNYMIRVFYYGNPRKAVNPPWDGGFSWEKDSNNNYWVGVSCQGLGASSWWPNKDHQSDEPDSMLITCKVPENLKCISNGNLVDYSDDENIYSWFVSYPINNYNVSINIGDYINFRESYIIDNDTLDLSYYVLSYNLKKARSHFAQVSPMLDCFYKYFGKYPFWDDGFALIETTYLGMEHQSGISYGNKYLPGYKGNTAFIAGLDFDFIIVHETGHEWWGNLITTNDIADMWVHEGFCTYSELLYVECRYGYQKMLDYANKQKMYIKNDSPIVGCYHVNHQGSSDMYNKGSLMLHTLRSLISNDELWFNIIKDLLKKFEYQTVDASEIIDFLCKETKMNLNSFFDQYLNYKNLPEFQYELIREGRNITLKYRWVAINNFEMPILLEYNNEDIWIYPTNEWKEKSLGKIDIRDFRVKEELFLIKIKKVK